MLNFRYRSNANPRRNRFEVVVHSNKYGIVRLGDGNSKVSGESGAVFSRNRITSYPSDEATWTLIPGRCDRQKTAFLGFIIVTQLLHLCGKARLNILRCQVRVLFNNTARPNGNSSPGQPKHCDRRFGLLRRARFYLPGRLIARWLAFGGPAIQETADALTSQGERQGIRVRIKWPFPGPRPHGLPDGPGGVDLIVTGAQFQREASETFDGQLRQTFADAGAKLVQAGVAKLQ
jgi:hypothetical protein